MLPFALAVLAAAAPATLIGDSSGCPTGPAASIGPDDAPTVVDGFLDPTNASAFATYMELRRLVSEYDGALAVRLYFARPIDDRDRLSAHARGWAIAMARAGRTQAALRLMSAEGDRRIYARLATPEGARELAQEVGVEPEVHARLIASRCLDEELTRTSVEVREQVFGSGSAVFRMPVFSVDGSVFEDASALDRLRPELARRASIDRRADLRRPSATPQPRARSLRLLRPVLQGVRLGGIGLPHRFVVMARNEDDPNLFMLLPPVLRFRSRNPGVLTVHIVARGGSLGAQRLRHRLCAARRLGRSLGYARLLATDPSSRRNPTPAVRDLLRALDEVPEERCTEGPDPATMALPDGGWLDGVPRTRGELEGLSSALLLLKASRRPLSPLIAPEPQEP